MVNVPFSWTRRRVLAGTAACAAAAALPASTAKGASTLPSSAQPLPLTDVRLLASPWLDAVEANQRYVLSLEPDRLLHNYRVNAGLKPKGAVYGGWEGDTIAGHTLGHYLSALALLHAQMGDEEACRRARYIVGELVQVQGAHGDGYVAGFTRKRMDGAIVNGKEIFAEITRGDIRAAPFDLNGCWVPFYNWHKLFAGLYDAARFCGEKRAMQVAVSLGGYIEKVFAALDDAQVQAMLDCEHGGINESFAELHARTGERRWLALAQRIHHRKVLDPLIAGRDELTNLHANTQIPKLIGLARLHELTGGREYAAGPRFFWQAVTSDYSYVIGGNSDREYFQAPRSISKYITEQTCESCNTYNMLKLTRHLFSWQPDGALFDYYERAHLNHILAQQNPRTGMFAYMVPLMSGTAREFSTPTDSFWCCVGSGMESHAKHGDSVWWQGEDTLFVNLFVPSRANWIGQGAQFEMTTRYPHEGRITLRLAKLERPSTFAVALRIPGWANSAAVSINDARTEPPRERGYALVRRRWQAGDTVTLDLPLDLRFEATPDDPDTVALLRGPLVLAADLGAADRPYEGAAPALVGRDLLAGIRPVAPLESVYRTEGIGRPGELRFVPFYSNCERRNAVYFKRYTDAQWLQARAALALEREQQEALDRMSVDVMRLGDEPAEREHALQSAISYAVSYRARPGRDARTGGFFAFRMKVAPGPLVLRATYWGGEVRRRFRILIDGEPIAAEALAARKPGEFFDVDYPIAERLTQGKEFVLVRFDPETGFTAGPVFGVRMFRPGAPVEST